MLWKCTFCCAVAQELLGSRVVSVFFSSRGRRGALLPTDGTVGRSTCAQLPPGFLLKEEAPAH